MKSLKDSVVLITSTSFRSMLHELCGELEEKVGEVRYNTEGRRLTAPELIKRLEGVDGLIAGLDEISSEVFEHSSSLQVVARYGVGVSNVDLEAARRHNVVVTNTPGANSRSVAELTIALVLNLLRPVISASEQVHEGKWPRMKGLAVAGKTVGLYGLGAIGREVARRLSCFDCEILAFDTAPDADFAQEFHVHIVEPEALIRQADILSLHLPAVPETHGMVDAEFLAAMKPGAYLVNTARGELVDEEALCEALQQGHLAGAAVDAFTLEPLPQDHCLLQLPNVIATPHMGAHTDDAAKAMGSMAVQDCLAVLRGEEPVYRVI